MNILRQTLRRDYWPPIVRIGVWAAGLLFLLVAMWLLAGPSRLFAADLPKKATVAIPAVAPSTPFYLGVNFGGGWLNSQQSFLTLPGEFAGTGNVYPTGLLTGVTAGAGANFGLLYVAAEVDVDYAWQHASQTVGNITFSSKNGMEITEGIWAATTMSTFTGALPTQVQLPSPSSWPIPVTVPSNIAAAQIMFGPKAGLAERWISACAENLAASICSNRVVYGPFVGAQIEMPFSTNIRGRLEYDHMFYNQSWTATGGTAGVFGDFHVTNSDRVLAKVLYPF